MEQATSIISRAVKTKGSTPSMPSGVHQAQKVSQLNSAQSSLVNDLFKIMQLRKPHLLNSAYPTEELVALARLEFAEQIIKAGLSVSMVKRGIEQLRNRYPLKYLPGPVEFVMEYCRPTAGQLGLPSPADAWLECCNHSHEVMTHRWSHRAVYEAGRKTGWHFLKTVSGQKALDQLQRQFNEHYQKQVEWVASGQSLKDRSVKALEDHSKDSEAEKAIRYGKQKMDQTLSEMGIPRKMSGKDALKKLRAML